MRHSTARLALFTVLAAGAALSGCKKDRAAGLPAQTEEAAATEAPEPAARPKREKQAMFRARGDATQTRLGLLDVTYEEVQALVPTLTGAVPIARPNVQTGGRQVNVVHCVAGDDIGKLEAELRQKLQAVGFDAIQKRDKKAVGRLPKPPLTMVAQKPPYHVTITATSAPFHDCKADEKKVRLVMSFFKRTDKAKAQGAAAATAPQSATEE